MRFFHKSIFDEVLSQEYLFQTELKYDSDRVMDFKPDLHTQIEFFTIRSHLHFKPEFTTRGLKICSQKLPPSNGT